MAVLQAGKRDWYEALGLDLKHDEANVVVMEDVGDEDNPAHLTVYREIWKYTFQLADGVAVIMDHIFGRGSRAAHVTLEDTGEAQDPRAFRDGPVYGNDQQTPLLEAFLQRRMEAAQERIAQLCEDYDSIEWDLVGTHELDKLEVMPGDAFRQMAVIASAVNKAEVEYPKQKDAALLLKAVSIHPLQALQNTYQRIVRDACRGITDEEKRKEKEAEQMANYFFFDSASPKPLAPAPDAPGDTEDQLAEATKRLQKFEEAMENAKAGDAQAAKERKPRARQILAGVQAVRALYANGAVAVPCLVAADDELAGLEGEIEAADTAPKFKAIHKKLTKAVKELTTAHQSYCCIQNFHIIEPFYLFRLLVKYRIYSDRAIPTKTRTEVSSTLTGLLHNSPHSAWLFTWLRDKLVQLNKLLATNCGPDKAVFFLKGGRAAKYLVGLERKGENDWDTQIVINPNLRASQWYEAFVKVHNTALGFLHQARAEFLIEVVKNAVNMEKAMAPELERLHIAKKKADREKAEHERELAEGEALARDLQNLFRSEDDEDKDEEVLDEAFAAMAAMFADEEDIDVPPDKEKVNCKAELIDIGIPRRDTAEAFEQWAHVRPYIINCKDGIPIPGHLYYINEYVMMIREAFAGISISMPKTPSRVIRLLEVLELPGLDPHVQHELDKIPKTLLPKSLSAITGLDKPVKHVLTIMLKQYMEAWDLKIDRGLALHFDTLFSSTLGDRAAKASYPGTLSTAISSYNDKEAKKKAEEQKKYEAKHKALADAIGFAQWLAETFSKHLTVDRHKFNTEPVNGRKYGAFLKAIYTGSFFGQGEDNLEVRMGVAGASAAALHSNAMQFERKEDLMPVTRIDLAIFCKGDADSATVLELIEPVVQQYVKNPKTPKYKVEKVGDDSLCLYWPEEVKIGEFTYTPLAIRIVVMKRSEDWPQLSFLKALPVLGLRDLVWEYKRLTGDTEENFTYRRLKIATDALVDLLTRFENPDAGKPWVRPGVQLPTPPKQPPPPDVPMVPPVVPPDTSAKVTDGYGEFLVVRLKGGVLEAPSATDFERAITRAVHPNTPFAYLDTNPRQGDVAGYLAGRAGRIDTKLAETDAELKGVFVPRSLYELMYINQIIKQELKDAPEPQWRFRPMQQYSVAYVTAARDLDAENVTQRHLLNTLFVKRIKALPGMAAGATLPLTQNQIKKLMEDEVKRFKELVGKCSSDDVIKSRYNITTPARTEPHSLGRKLNGWLAGKLDGMGTLLTNAMLQECDATGRLLLYRGTGFNPDRVDMGDGMPMSFNTSLLAGVVYDYSGVTFTPAFALQGGNYGYCMKIPFEDLLGARFPFHVPHTNAMKQLFGHDQFFHAWSKTTAEFIGRLGALDSNSHLQHLTFPGTLGHVQESFAPYFNEKVRLT